MDSNDHLSDPKSSEAPTDERAPLGTEPGREPVAPEPLAAADVAPLAARGAPQAAPAPEPGTVWCAKCATAVVPRVPNHCPACGAWVFDNNASLIHGLRSDRLAKKIDAYRVDLIEQLFAERGGRDALDVVSRIAIENYALVCAQHKTIEERLDHDGLFTKTGRRRSAFDMLKSISETIDRLRAELPPPIKTPTSTSVNVDDLSAAALEQRGLVIVEMARALQRAEEFERAPCGPDDTDGGDPIVDATPIDDAPSPAPTPSPSPSPSPEPLCTYCNQTVTRCGQIKESNLSAWRAMHCSDPEEVARRDREATAVMYAMVGRPPGVPHLDVARSAPESDPYAGLSPEERERERKAAAIRQALGWDVGVIRDPFR